MCPYLFLVQMDDLEVVVVPGCWYRAEIYLPRACLDINHDCKCRQVTDQGCRPARMLQIVQTAHQRASLMFNSKEVFLACQRTSKGSGTSTR